MSHNSAEPNNRQGRHSRTINHILLASRGTHSYYAYLFALIDVNTKRSLRLKIMSESTPSQLNLGGSTHWVMLAHARSTKSYEDARQQLKVSLFDVL
jgi:hypothetical protein